MRRWMISKGKGRKRASNKKNKKTTKRRKSEKPLVRPGVDKK